MNAPPWLTSMTQHSMAITHTASQLARLSPTARLLPGLLFLYHLSPLLVLVALVVVTPDLLYLRSSFETAFPRLLWALVLELWIGKVVNTAILWVNIVLHLSNNAQCYTSKSLPDSNWH